VRTTLVAVVLKVGIVAWTGCGGLTPTDAREELTVIGVEYSPARFVVAARDNDLRAVELFMVAGMDVNVEVRGGSTPDALRQRSSFKVANPAKSG